MALVYKDRVKETTTTTGTSTYTLGGASAGFQPFSAIGNANTCEYCCEDGTNWEVGLGTYTLSGTTLARTTIYASSNSGAAVSWSAGSKNIFCTLPAQSAVTKDGSGNVTVGGNITTSGGQVTLGVVGTSGLQLTNTGIIGTMDAQDLVLRTSSTARITINATTGNVGFGISSPRAWRTADYLSIDYLYGSIFGNSGNFGIGTNLYLDATNQWHYVVNAPVAMYLQSGGAHYWYSKAAGGTGTFAVSNTMTLDVSGNLTTIGAIKAIASGGYGAGTEMLGAAISAAGVASAVNPVARFSNTGAGYATKIVLTDSSIADCFITYVPNATPANSKLGFGIHSNYDQFVFTGTGTMSVGTGAMPTNALTINSAWGTYGSYSEALAIVGSYPSFAFRSTTSNSVFLQHMDASGNLTWYFTNAGTGYTGSSWASKMSLTPAGVLQVTGNIGASNLSGTNTGDQTSVNTLVGDQTNWATYRSSAVANMLGWKNYGNNHVIFDASNSTAPNGAGCSNTDPTYAWATTYPTLMGWNGSSTYGVRVDASRVSGWADYCANAQYVYRTETSGYDRVRNAYVYYADLGRTVYNNGAYSGTGWVEPSDLGVRYANSAGSASSASSASSATTAGSISGSGNYCNFANVWTGSSYQAMGSWTYSNWGAGVFSLVANGVVVVICVDNGAAPGGGNGVWGDFWNSYATITSVSKLKNY